MDGLRAEAFDAMQDFYRTAHVPLVRCVIRFEGRADAETLTRAVGLTLSAVPQAACGYDGRRGRWVPAGLTAADMVEVFDDPDGSKLERLRLSDIDIDRGPQLRLFLSRGAESDSLCVLVSHLVSDGAGFKRYLFLLAETYSRCAADPAYRTPAEPGDRSLGQLLRGRGFFEKLKIVFQRFPVTHQEPALYPPLRGDAGRPFLVRCVLERELLASVAARAKRSGASVNDMILTAYARALGRWTGQRRVELPCPVDLRKYIKDPAACGVCNLTGNFRCAVGLAPGEPFETTLRRVSAQMTRQKASEEGLKWPAVLGLAFRALPYRVIRRSFPKAITVPVVSYTNMGVIDEKRLAFGALRAGDVFLSTAVKYAPYFQIAVSTWRDVCSLCSSFHGTPEDEAAVRRFLGEIRGELAAAAEE